MVEIKLSEQEEILERIEVVEARIAADDSGFVARRRLLAASQREATKPYRRGLLSRY